MAKAKTIFYLGADANTVYDVSTKCHALKMKGKVKILIDSRTLKFQGGSYIETKKIILFR